MFAMEYCMSQEDIDLLRGMIERYSPSTEESEVSTFLIEAMKQRGFKAYHDAVGNAVGEVGEGDRHIVLIGHIDTVAGIVPVREKNGILYGRGTVDAKGSFATFVSAVSRLTGVQGTRITVIGAVEEECSTSRGAWHLIDQMRPDCVFVGEPSGWDSITIGYKGIVCFDYHLEQPNAHFAGNNIRTSERAIRLYNDISDYVARQGAGREFDSPRLELRRFNTSDNGIIDGTTAYYAVRIPPAYDIDALINFVQDHADGADITFNQRLEGIVTEKNTPIIRSLLKGIRQAGGKPTFKKKTGTSDMCVVGPAWMCPIVAYGPGDSKLDHTPDEHMVLDEYIRAIDVLTFALKQLI